MAWIIEQVQKPALVIAHNKTLAAQLCNEFREFFPNNAVEYFVSYYDYYQRIVTSPIYIGRTPRGTTIFDRLRHAATSACSRRAHTVVVASVSSSTTRLAGGVTKARLVFLTVGEEADRDLVLRKLIDIHTARNDTLLGPAVPGEGRRGRDPARALRDGLPISFFATPWQISHFDPLTGEVLSKLDHITCSRRRSTSRPSRRSSAPSSRSPRAREQVKFFESKGMMLEAQPHKQRTDKTWR